MEEGEGRIAESLIGEDYLKSTSSQTEAIAPLLMRALIGLVMT